MKATRVIHTYKYWGEGHAVLWIRVKSLGWILEVGPLDDAQEQFLALCSGVTLDSSGAELIVDCICKANALTHILSLLHPIPNLEDLKHQF